MRTSEWIRYKDGLWIPHRKRTYLYWFKFLQEAEKSADYKVNWRKYRGWGGPNEILGSKFDAWWQHHWVELFASEDRWADRNSIKFPLSTTRPKTEAIRLALLVYQNRNTPPDWTPRNYVPVDGFRKTTSTSRRGGKTLAIARKVIQLEKRQTTPIWQIDPDQMNADEQVIQSRVGRYMRNANKILGNVCEGRFP